MRIATTLSSNAFKIHVSRLVLVIVLLEVFLGGGGRLIDIGPLSLRMYFFILGLALSVLILIDKQSININFLIVLVIASVLLFTSSFIGFINGASLKSIISDVKPLLSIYFILFFYYTIRTENDVYLIIKLIKGSSLILALGYILIFSLINSGFSSFGSFYRLVAHTEEFFFRGEFAFFYKGFIYMCVGLFFFIIEDKINKPVVGILVLAIVLTFTRGFFLSIGLTYLIYLIFIKSRVSNIILYTVIIALTVLFFWNMIYTDKIDRKGSNSDRVVQIREVINDVTPVTALVGHGFGIGVPSRRERMEIAYLEIFHKQGILGILFWGILILLNILLYRRAISLHQPKIVVPFLLSVVLIYLQSFTNAFLNNPIGLTMILVSLVCLNVLSRKPLISEN